MSKNKLAIHISKQPPEKGVVGVIKDGFFLPGENVFGEIKQCYRYGTTLYVNEIKNNVVYKWMNIAGLDKNLQCKQVIDIKTTTIPQLDVSQFITTSNVKYYVADLMIIINGIESDIVYRCNFNTNQIKRIHESRYKKPMYKHEYFGKYFCPEYIFKCDSTRKEYMSGVAGTRNNQVEFGVGKDVQSFKFKSRNGYVSYNLKNVFGGTSGGVLSFWIKFDKLPEIGEKHYIFYEESGIQNTPTFSLYLTAPSNDSGYYYLEAEYYFQGYKYSDVYNSQYGYYRSYSNNSIPKSNLKQGEWFLITLSIDMYSNSRVYFDWKSSSYSSNFTCSSSNYHRNYHNLRNGIKFYIGNSPNKTQGFVGEICEIYYWKNEEGSYYVNGSSGLRVRQKYRNFCLNAGLYYRDKYSIETHEQMDKEYIYDSYYYGSFKRFMINNEILKSKNYDFSYKNFTSYGSNNSSSYYRYLIIDKQLYRFSTSSDYYQVTKVSSMKGWTFVDDGYCYNNYVYHKVFGICNGQLYRMNCDKQPVLVDEIRNNWTMVKSFNSSTNSLTSGYKYYLYGIAGGQLYSIIYDGNGYDNTNNVMGYIIEKISDRNDWTYISGTNSYKYYDSEYYGIYGVASDGTYHIVPGYISKISDEKFTEINYCYSSTTSSNSYGNMYYSSTTAISESGELALLKQKYICFLPVAANCTSVAFNYISTSSNRRQYFICEGNLFMVNADSSNFNPEVIDSSGDWKKVAGYTDNDFVLAIKNDGSLYVVYSNNVYKMTNQSKYIDLIKVTDYEILAIKEV